MILNSLGTPLIYQYQNGSLCQDRTRYSRIQNQTHHSAGKNPVWNEVFEFLITNEETLHLRVHNKDLLKDDHVGSGTFSISQLLILPSYHFAGNVPLMHKSKSAGEIYIKGILICFSLMIEKTRNASRISTAVPTTRLSSRLRTTNYITSINPYTPNNKYARISSKTVLEALLS